ncbi:NapD-like protein [Flavisolibacter tropicus]|uniref:NapD-like protein n=2 Tax=Flavisolibacter tropicus TaxID=1492898 RepID=A0A172U1J6_9BACT|nr:NapD-like protein [Flavisolibacter tropicus]
MSLGKASMAQYTAESYTDNDPLPAWNNGKIKQAIISYIQQITDSTSTHFIPVIDRIATFDNDGTLWAEQPLVQELFILYQVKKMVEKKPALKNQQPFKAIIENDTAYFKNGGQNAILELVAATHTGMTEDEFEAAVKDFFSMAIYPGRNVPVKQITYQPQIELLNYLRANGFKTFICSGGTVEFVRSISEELYGIPKYQVIGTTFKYKFNDSTVTIMREPASKLSNDKEGKPVGIQMHIGQRPVFACGNERSGGDIAMLKYSQSSKYPTFQLLINHDDAAREYAYQEKDNASLKAAAKYNWYVVSMKMDWKTVFVKEP